MKNTIIRFLKQNGFERLEKNSYANDLCNVVLDDFSGNDIAIADCEGNAVYCKKYNLFWLIGVLVYNSYLTSINIKTIIE